MSRRHRLGSCGSRGGATVVLLAVFVVGMVATVAAARLGAVMLADARARTAADAAALAGAGALARGAGADAACRTAARFAGDNGADLVACTATADMLTVAAAVTVPGLGRVARAEAAAQVDAPGIPAP